MKDVVFNIWKLRGELDNAVISGNYQKIREVKEKYQDLVKEQNRFGGGEFICYWHGFYTDAERIIHRNLNMRLIQDNIDNFEKKYLGGGDVDLRLHLGDKTQFLACDIWTIRAMYDKFLLQAENSTEEWQKQQNMILGKVILERLITLADMEPTEEFKREIIEIIKEVREGYADKYQKKEPQTDYFSLSSEFLER